jgi:hypothetical protein
MARRLTYRITVCFTPEDGQEIEHYIRQKKRWKKPADLARDAIEQLMTRNALTDAQRRAITEGYGK